MGSFPEYDPEQDVIHLNGGREIVLALLLKAKFGERFDRETLLHPSLSKLIRELDPHDVSVAEKNPKFTVEELHAIAREIYSESWRSGWWSSNSEERATYIQDAVAPWVLPQEQIDRVIDDVEDLRWNNARILKAAGGA